MMRRNKIRGLLVGVVAASLIFAGCGQDTGQEEIVSSSKPIFEDGMAQPMLQYTDLRNADYTNEDSDILRYCVYVETDHDTDGDGKADLVEALVQVPRSAAEGGFSAATIYDPTPYGAGTVEEGYEEPNQFLNPIPFDYEKLYEPGKKRSPKGSMDTLEAAEIADPESWNYSVPVSGESGYAYAHSYDYYLVRGFAVVEAGGIGTYGSEGFELCGFDLERDAHKCVVEWLTGDRVAFTDPYNDIEIKADWSNGNVAMTGCSYGGTLPFEVATTGVKGLKTIIPFAGIASWYDYTNSQGVPLSLYASYGYGLAAFNSGAAFLDDDWTVINDDYASFLWQFSKDQRKTNGDYAKIWERLDYSLDSSKINCSALIVHGLNDFNVSTKQSDLMARSFARAKAPFKLVLHQDGHNILNGSTVFGELWEETMNKWLSHYLYDVDNDVESLPQVTVQSNVDGSFHSYDTWGDFDYVSFEYDEEVNPEEVSHIDTTPIAEFFDGYSESTDKFDRPLIRDDYYLALPEEAEATYAFTLPDNFTCYGVPEVHLRMATQNADMDGLMVSAMLIDTIDGETPFKAYMTKSSLNDRVPKKTTCEMEAGGGLSRTKCLEFVKSNTTSKLITYGHTDLKNYGGGYEGKDYKRHKKPMKAGKYYDYTIYLQPTSYTFEPGHQAVLVITGWDPFKGAFLDEDYASGMLEDPSESSYTYSFDIDNSAFELSFPLEKGKGYAEEASEGAVDEAAVETENFIPIHFATKKEGTKLMLANDKYYEEFTPNKLEFTMQKKDATMEDYLDFAEKQVLDWTDEEKDRLTRGMERIEEVFDENGWTMPPLDTVEFIKTTMQEENDVTAYTHGTQIYMRPLNEIFPEEAFADGQLPDEFIALLAHELFHCLSRCNRDFREQIYSIIGFTVEDKDFELPPSVWEYFIANPDVENHDSWATFEINGEEIDCYTAFVTTRHFEKEGDRFFDVATTALVPVDGSDVYYTKDEATNFDEVFGRNTDYVVDPQECMADNFSYAVAFGADGPTGDGYQNPEIIEGVIDVLRAE